MSHRIALPLALAGCFAAVAAAPAAAVTGPPSFAAPIRLAAPSNHGVAVGDFDGDGRMDVAAGRAAAVSVWLATGNVSTPFQQAPNRPVVDGSGGLVAGDFDGDGRDDVAVANSGSDSVSILRGEAGGLGAAISVPVGDSPVGIAEGDLDGDGDLDLAVANLGSGPGVSVLVNDGQGVFTAQSIDVDCATTSVAIGDLVGDGRADVAAVCLNSSLGVVILRSEDTGLARVPGSSPACDPRPTGTARDIAVGRFEGDVKDDVAVVCQLDRFAVLSSGRGFAPLPGPEDTPSNPQPWFPIPRANAGAGVAENVATADLNGDGFDDVLTASSADPYDVVVADGDGAGHFFPETGSAGRAVGTRYPMGAGLDDLIARDVDGDGRRDLVASVGSEVWVRLNSTPMPSLWTGSAADISLGSFNGGHPAILGGTVNPNGNGTSYRFQYGTTRAYGETTPAYPTGTNLSGTADQPVSVLVQDLAPGTLYHYRIVATNGNGTTYGLDRTFRTKNLPPDTTSAPAIAGTPGAGRVLTCDEGGWLGTPTFEYAWLRNGSTIPGATGRDYTVTGDDAGTALQCQVKATNAGGAATATSPPVVVPAPEKPAPGGDPAPGGNTTPGGTETPGGNVLPVPLFTSAPAIAGSSTVGQTLTCRTGTTTGDPSLTVSWRRNGVPIAGAGGVSYTLRAADALTAIQCRVLATGAGGATVADSAPVVAVPIPCVVPKLGGLTLAKARKSLAAASCKLGTVTRKTSRARRDRVVGSTPKAGKRLAPGSAVAVVLSTGRR